jgi:hypothetical protein
MHEMHEMPEMSCKLKTGDLLLCDDLQYSSWGLFSWFIKFMTKSDFSHVGMIVVDPVFTDVPLKGTYVWTSGISDVPDPEDNTKKFGVQLVPYDHFITTYGGKIYVRRIEFESTEKYTQIFSNEKLKEIHKVVYDKPYDMVVTDWIEAYCKKDPNPQKTSRFFCSAFIGYVYTKLTLLDEGLDWSILYPSYFSSENKTFSLHHNAILSKEHQISN